MFHQTTSSDTLPGNDFSSVSFIFPYFLFLPGHHLRGGVTQRHLFKARTTFPGSNLPLICMHQNGLFDKRLDVGKRDE